MSSTSPEQDPLDPGEVVLDRYRVVENIASGGHSVVYRGQDERLSRPVCIKVFSRLPTEAGISKASYQHFVQEAFALSRLTHPNTLRIYDFGHISVERDDKKGEVPFQVCEYMNGGTLANVVRDLGPQPASETLRIVGAVCDALGEAHGLGIVHRDIKPQNILFAEVGKARLPKLADFGIAKWMDDTTSENRAGDTQVVAGAKLAMYSPSWAAPEQLAGQPVGPSTDIYSLAVVAIYMMTGVPIFACDDVYEGYRKRRHGDRLMREAFAGLALPEPALVLLARALAFSPFDRPTKIGDFMEALGHAFEPSTAELVRLPATDPVTTSVRAPITPVTMKLSAAELASDDVAPGRAAVHDGAPLQAPPGHARTGGPPPLPGNATVAAPPPVARPPAPPPRLAPVAVAGASPAGAQAPTAPPRRLGVSQAPVSLADRVVHFLETKGDVADIADVATGIRLRVTLQVGVGGARIVHLKPLSCFIALPGGRPTSAVQIAADSVFDLTTPRQDILARAYLALGSPAAGHRVFPLGAEPIAIGVEECPEVVLIDFGTGRGAYFVYTAGPGQQRASAPPSRRGPTRSKG